MGYYAVMILAIALTIFALWKPNVLLAIVSSAAWWGFLAYHLENPPVDMETGSPADTAIVLALIGMALAIPVMIVSRWKATGSSFTGGGFSSGEPRQRQPKLLSEMNVTEYSAYLRKRMKRRR